MFACVCVFCEDGIHDGIDAAVAVVVGAAANVSMYIPKPMVVFVCKMTILFLRTLQERQFYGKSLLKSRYSTVAQYIACVMQITKALAQVLTFYFTNVYYEYRNQTNDAKKQNNNNKNKWGYTEINVRINRYN